MLLPRDSSQNPFTISSFPNMSRTLSLVISQRCKSCRQILRSRNPQRHISCGRTRNQRNGVVSMLYGGSFPRTLRVRMFSYRSKIKGNTLQFSDREAENNTNERMRGIRKIRRCK